LTKTFKLKKKWVVAASVPGKKKNEIAPGGKFPEDGKGGCSQFKK